MESEFTKFRVSVRLGKMQMTDTLEARNAPAAMTILRTKLSPLFPDFDDQCRELLVQKAYEHDEETMSPF